MELPDGGRHVGQTQAEAEPQQQKRSNSNVTGKYSLLTKLNYMLDVLRF